MDGVYDPKATAGKNIAGLIRSYHSGQCSGEPTGVEYPDVPTVEEVVTGLGIDPEELMDEGRWNDACDYISPPNPLYTCPKCGSNQGLSVSVLIWVKLTQHGDGEIETEDDGHEGHEWGDDSRVVCDCGWTGVTKQTLGK